MECTSSARHLSCPMRYRKQRSLQRSLLRLLTPDSRYMATASGKPSGPAPAPRCRCRWTLSSLAMCFAWRTGSARHRLALLDSITLRALLATFSAWLRHAHNVSYRGTLPARCRHAACSRPAPSAPCHIAPAIAPRVAIQVGCRRAPSSILELDVLELSRGCRTQRSIVEHQQHQLPGWSLLVLLAEHPSRAGDNAGAMRQLTCLSCCEHHLPASAPAHRGAAAKPAADALPQGTCRSLNPSCSGAAAPAILTALEAAGVGRAAGRWTAPALRCCCWCRVARQSCGWRRWGCARAAAAGRECWS
jgi:hypothetical protein